MSQIANIKQEAEAEEKNVNAANQAPTLEMMLEKIEKRVNTNKKNEVEGSTLPLFPEQESAMPNHLARSSLFAPIRQGRRKLHERTKLATRSDCTIYYTGKQLDQADADVFLQSLAYLAPPDIKVANPLFISRSAFLKELDRATGNKNYIWLDESFERLTTSNIIVETTRYKAVFHLIDAYVKDEETKSYWISIHPEIIKLFKFQEFSFINLHKRKLINKTNQLAKWLQGYIATHKNGEIHTIKVEYLHKWATNGEGRLRDFRERALPHALQELESLGIVVSWKIRKDDRVTWFPST
jgi:hypothetical protein